MNNNNVLTVNNRLWNIAMFFGVLAIIVTLVVLSVEDNKTTVFVSPTGCCTITVSEVGNNKYLVNWTDNTMLDSSYSEISDAETLDWTIAEFQDFCYTQHGHIIE